MTERKNKCEPPHPLKYHLQCNIRRTRASFPAFFTPPTSRAYLLSSFHPSEHKWAIRSPLSVRYPSHPAIRFECELKLVRVSSEGYWHCKPTAQAVTAGERGGQHTVEEGDEEVGKNCRWPPVFYCCRQSVRAGQAKLAVDSSLWRDHHWCLPHVIGVHGLATSL